LGMASSSLLVIVNALRLASKAREDGSSTHLDMGFAT
jgi:hypothetical protein